MAEGTKDSIRDVATAIGEGFSAAKTPHTLRCPKCGVENETSAHFCRQCGVALDRSKKCDKCGHLNSAGARFCDQCGLAIA
jgi:ribosomal protein L40E